MTAHASATPYTNAWIVRIHRRGRIVYCAYEHTVCVILRIAKINAIYATKSVKIHSKSYFKSLSRNNNFKHLLKESVRFEGNHDNHGSPNCRCF